MPACCPSHCCFPPSHWSTQNAGQAMPASDWSAQSSRLLIGRDAPHPTDWKCKNAQKSNRAASGGWGLSAACCAGATIKTGLRGRGHGGDGARGGLCWSTRTGGERKAIGEKRCTLLCFSMGKKCVFHAWQGRHFVQHLNAVQ